MARGSENMEHYGKLGTNMHGVLVHNHHGLVPNHNIDQIIRSSPMPLSQQGLIPGIKDMKDMGVKKSSTQYRRELMKQLLKRASRLISQQVSQSSASLINKRINHNDNPRRQIVRKDATRNKSIIGIEDCESVLRHELRLLRDLVPQHGFGDLDSPVMNRH